MRRALVALLALLAWTPATVPAQSADPVSVKAETSRSVGDVTHLEGMVTISYQDITIRCDRMVYNRATMDVEASGNIVLDRGPSRLTCNEMEFNLRSKAGVFWNAAGEIEPYYSFTAQRLEKLDERRYLLEDATFTSCEAGDRPPWNFDIASALLEEEGYGRFKRVALKTNGVPVFYLPYMVWPIKRDRSPGLLMPSFGYSDRRGFYLGNSLYLPLGRSYDTTLYLDYFSEGYYGLGTEWRWAPVTGALGELTLYTIWDPVGEAWQWKLHGRHEQADLLGFRLIAEVENLSDIDFFQEFERSFDANTRRSLYSYALLTRSRGTATTSIRVDDRTTFLEPDDVVLRQLPEVELRLRPSRIGSSSLYWSMISSVNLFDVDRGAELKATYGRVDLFPEASYTLPGPPWLTVTPRFGARGTYYTHRLAADRRSYESDPIDRTYLTAGVDLVGPSLSRVFDRPLGKFRRFKHLIEPRIEYDFVSDVEDQLLIPTFDEVDSTLVLNKARVSLANRLFARAAEGVSAQEIASLELYQEYSFDNPLNRGDGVRTSQWGYLGASLRVTPGAGLSFDARASYDTLFSNLVSHSLSLGSFREPVQLAATWYESFDPRSGSRSSSQVRTMLGFRRRGFPLQVTAHVAYDLEQSEFQQQRLLLAYEGSCWSLSAEYRDLQLGLYPSREYRLLLSLKGVGSLPEITGNLGGGGS